MTLSKTKIINTVKISVAAIIAIIIASLLDVQFAISAGIVAILSVAPTKKETLKTALGRLLAFLVALIISFVCYNLIGFNAVAFCVYLVIFILICQCFGWISAMAMDSVLISHFLTLGNMSLSSIGNECLLFVIGVSLGILVNLYLHKDEKQIEALKDKVDSKIRHILLRMSERIMDNNLEGYDGTCFDELWESLYEAEKVAHSNYLNEIISDKSDKEYISMRRNQVSVLREMYKNVKSIRTSPETAKSISDYLRKVSATYSRENTVEELLSDLNTLISSMKEFALPETREEFEDRAKLFALLSNLKEFLKIKHIFMIKN